MENIYPALLMLPVWHVSAVGTLSLYTDTLHKSRFFVPSRVLTSRPHIAGTLCLSGAALCMVLGEYLNLLALGFVLAGTLLILDVMFIRRALTRFG